MLRGILINPGTRELTEVEVGDGLQPYYDHLSTPEHKVDCFAIGYQWFNGDTLYVDDNGLLFPDLKVFKVEGQPLAGRGLILGSDEEGNSVDAKMPIHLLATMIEWTTLVTTGGA